MLLYATGGAAAQEPGAPEGQTPVPPERIRVPAAGEAEESAPQPESPADAALTTRRFDFEMFRSRLEAHWFKRKILLKQNLQDAAREELDEIRELCRETGVERLSTLGAALAHEGDEFLLEGNFRKARDSYEGALIFAPGLPTAHAGLAAVAWKSGEGLLIVGQHATAAFVSSLRESWYEFRSLANGLIVLIVVLAALAIVFSLILLARYHRALRHDVEEALVGRLSPSGARVASLVVLLLPLLTIVLAPWSPAWWLALFFRYSRIPEKIVSLSLLVLLALSGPLLRFSQSTFELSGDPGAQLLLDSASGSYEPDAIVALEEAAEAHPDDGFYPSLLGAIFVRGRFLEEALQENRAAAKLDPADPRPHNSIGNIYFRVGRYAEASQAYRTAIELDPSLLPAYVNLYLARQAMFEFRLADEALQQGRAVDAGRMAALLESRKEQQISQEPIETPPTSAEIWRRILSRQSGSADRSADIRRGLASTSSVIGLCAIFIALVLPAIGGTRHALLCVKCGQPFCYRCQTGKEAPDHCMQCRFLFLKRDGIHPAVRRGKLEEVARYELLRGRLASALSLAIPGAGMALEGRTLRGTGLMLFWLGLLGGVALHERLLVPPHLPAVETPLLVAACSLALLIWIAGNRALFRRSRNEAAA